MNKKQVSREELGEKHYSGYIEKDILDKFDFLAKKEGRQRANLLNFMIKQRVSNEFNTENNEKYKKLLDEFLTYMKNEQIKKKKKENK